MMKKCKCGSFAVNIERLTGENCDVCHYKNQVETLRTENAKLIAERDMYKNNCVAYECNCVSCKTKFIGEKEQHICFKCLLADREQWMKQEPYGYVHPEDE